MMNMKNKIKEYIAIEDWFEKEKMKIKENYVNHKDDDIYQEQLEELLNERDVKLEELEQEED